MEQLYEMAAGVWNSHMPDDVTCSEKVKIVSQIYLDGNITKIDGDRGWLPKEMAYGKPNGHVIEIQDGGHSA